MDGFATIAMAMNSDIKKLYLAGPMTDYKILWDMIKKENPFGGEKELILCGELENVVTRGLSLL